MRKLLSIPAALVAVAFLAGPALAGKSENSVIVIDDKGDAFTADGIKKAEDAFHAVLFKSPTHLTVAVYKKVPDNKRSDYEAAKADKDAKSKFFKSWTTELAEKRGARGVFVLVSMEGAHIRAIDDRQTDARRGFGDADLKTLETKLGDGFVKGNKVKDNEAEAKKAHDEGLLNAVNFVVAELKNTSAPDTIDRGGAVKKPQGGLSTLQWVLVIGGGLLVMWIVIGLIRALTGAGGGGGGYGGGGGGGGFFSSLMGGMFGAMAGMYLYNSMFGGGMSSASASDSYGGNDGGSYDTGAGDYDGGGDGGGTDFGGGDFGGGDGAGGDWGGGGDFGGGGDW